MGYTLESHDDGRDRPYVIRRPDGTSLFSFTAIDERHARETLCNLNAVVSLSPEDADELLARSA